MPSRERIVILLPTWVGDAVMATPALRAMRRRFAGDHITLAGREAVLDTLSGLDVCDEAAVNPAMQTPGLFSLFDGVAALRAGRYTMAILLPNSFRSALLARMAGIKRLAGYNRDARGLFLSDALDPPRNSDGSLEAVSAVDYYAALAEMLGAAVDSRRVALGVTDDCVQSADNILAAYGRGAGPLVVLNPGAAFGASKVWDPECFAALANMLTAQRGAEIILNAAPNERDVARRIARTIERPPLVNLADLDNSIGLLKALLARSDLLVTGDTGPRHLAAGLGVNVVTLFGGTDPRLSAIDFGRERIVRVNLPCSPCQQKLCPQPAGPLYHKCMADITPEMVLAVVDELLPLGPQAEGADR